MFAVVEIMGHRTRAGVISDVTLGGATMLRIEHPTLADHTGDEPLTEIYAATAIFGIRPCSQEEAIAVADWAWSRPVVRPPMPELARQYLEDDDDEIDDAVIHAEDCANSDGACFCGAED